MTGLQIQLSLVLRDKSGKRGPWMVAMAYMKLGASVEPALLASAWIQCSSTDFVSLDIAAFRVLYTLDGKLDSDGEQEVKPK